MSLTEPEGHSQRLRHWQASEAYERSWSGTQLHSNPATTPGRWNDEENDEDDKEFKLEGTSILQCN